MFSRSMIDNSRSIIDDSRVMFQLVVSFTIIIFYSTGHWFKNDCKIIIRGLTNINLR
jgi:hypothetical protein